MIDQSQQLGCELLLVVSTSIPGLPSRFISEDLAGFYSGLRSVIRSVAFLPREMRLQEK